MKWNEESYSDVIGLDASCYLRFTRMCRNFLFAIALLGAASLIPINVIFSVNNVDGPRRNILSMMTIQVRSLLADRNQTKLSRRTLAKFGFGAMSGRRTPSLSLGCGSCIGITR